MLLSDQELNEYSRSVDSAPYRYVEIGAANSCEGKTSRILAIIQRIQIQNKKFE